MLRGLSAASTRGRAAQGETGVGGVFRGAPAAARPGHASHHRCRSSSPGMVTLVARHGKLVYSDVYGVQDIASKKPMTQDTIFRIYSMTKPITGVAMMILYEEGKWQPGRSAVALHPGVRGPEGLRGPRRAGQADARSARASADHGRADDAHGRLHVRHLRRHAGRQDSTRRRTALGARRCRTSSSSCRPLPLAISRARSGCTACRSTSRAISSRSSRASRCRTSCASASSSRSA